MVLGLGLAGVIVGVWLWDRDLGGVGLWRGRGSEWEKDRVIGREIRKGVGDG